MTPQIHERDPDLLRRITRLERTNARLTGAFVGTVLLGAGVVLGGLGSHPHMDDPITHYVATDDSLYRIRESGTIEYLRLENSPLRTAVGVFDWGKFNIDETLTLPDRP